MEGSESQQSLVHEPRHNITKRISTPYRPQIWKTTNTMDFPDSPIALNKSTEIALKHDSISDYCAHFQGPSDNSFPDLYLKRESLAAPLQDLKIFKMQAAGLRFSFTRLFHSHQETSACGVILLLQKRPQHHCVNTLFLANRTIFTKKCYTLLQLERNTQEGHSNDPWEI